MIFEDCCLRNLGLGELCKKPPALTITPLAGGTHPAVASMVIQQLG
jgi:hypothetical protein